MASSTKSPGNIITDGTVGSKDWNNPSNAGTSDNSYADVFLDTNEVSYYLKCTQFGFAIPSGATINGVQANIERACSDNVPSDTGALDNVVKLVKAGTISGNNKAITTLYPTTDTVQSYGGAADLWGLTLTYSDVNNTGFGIVLSTKGFFFGGAVTAYVDLIQLVVTYTVAGTTYTQSLTAGLTTAGTIIRKDKKAAAGTLTDSGALTKIKLQTKSIAGTLTTAGAIVKKALKVLLSSYTSNVKGTSKGANDTSTGTKSWSNTGNTAAADGTEASVSLGTGGGA